MCICPKCLIPNNKPSSCRYKPTPVHCHLVSGILATMYRVHLPPCIHYNAPHVHISDGLCLRSDSLHHRDTRDGGYGKIVLHHKCIIFYSGHKLKPDIQQDFSDSDLLVKCFSVICWPVKQNCQALLDNGIGSHSHFPVSMLLNIPFRPYICIFINGSRARNLLLCRDWDMQQHL